MKEPYSEGLASHTDPESCVGAREDTGEALTRAHAGEVLSCEIDQSGTPTLLSEAEGNVGHSDKGELCASPAQSETLSMRGNSLHGNRRVPGVPPPDGRGGRLGKAGSHKPDVHIPGKSDDCIVPRKLPNKGMGDMLAEVVEGRRSTKGNTERTATPRTQSRKSVLSGMQRVLITS